MARFDFYEIMVNHPDWEESYHYITDPDIRRDIMLDVEQISQELAPTAMHQVGGELEWIDLVFNDAADPQLVVETTRAMLWNYSEVMIRGLIEDEAAKHADEMDIKPETALDLGVRDSDF